MDVYEREGRKYAEKKRHTVFKGSNGQLFVYVPDGLSEWNDEPDERFESWKDYTNWYIGRNLRKLRKSLSNKKKHLRKKRN